MTSEIQLAGFGGQGILFAGKSLHTAECSPTERFHGFPATAPK